MNPHARPIGAAWHRVGDATPPVSTPTSLPLVDGETDTRFIRRHIFELVEIFIALEQNHPQNFRNSTCFQSALSVLLLAQPTNRSATNTIVYSPCRIFGPLRKLYPPGHWLWAGQPGSKRTTYGTVVTHQPPPPLGRGWSWVVQYSSVSLLREGCIVLGPGFPGRSARARDAERVMACFSS